MFGGQCFRLLTGVAEALILSEMVHQQSCCLPCRDSNPQMRGVKVYGGQPVKAGGIIMRQLGTKVGAAAC